MLDVSKHFDKMTLPAPTHRTKQKNVSTKLQKNKEKNSAVEAANKYRSLAFSMD